ncbi:MAG: OmpH family outer membrane protein [Ignavibacteriae bacterium]|nr:OmpH family outer membrane protein [Ignavibacteriota bacterium]NOG99253.1 OmpH family outer membrane protein [Ignavibacteriota bacterium]
MSKISLEKSGLYLVALVIIYAAIVGTLNFINAPKVGYIDSSILMEKFPSAITARAELNTKAEEWQANTKTLEDELNMMNKEILEESPKWNKKTMAAKQDEFKKKQMEYARYSKAIQKKAAELENELFQPVFTELNNKIKEFGDNQGYEIIFGTLTGGNILFAEEGSNLTDDFLSYTGAI